MMGMGSKMSLPTGVPPRPAGFICQVIWLFRYAPVLMTLSVVLAVFLGWAAAVLGDEPQKKNIPIPDTALQYYANAGRTEPSGQPLQIENCAPDSKKWLCNYMNAGRAEWMDDNPRATATKGDIDAINKKLDRLLCFAQQHGMRMLGTAGSGATEADCP